MSTTETSVYEWADLNWRAIEKQVYKLQKRIYQAAQRGEVKTVHRLQRLLMRSWAARCLATRRVTQDNRGKKTAGVDGIKNVSPERRLQLATLLTLPVKARPTRRVWIPKPGAPAEKRPLAIPVMKDRAEQALVKLALEPEWESRCEPNTYGFRPGRSCHDAIEAIFLAIRYKPKYVLDADIAKCFERINHQALLDKLHTFPAMRRAIRAWLKAGVLDGETLYPTEEGVPQGGGVSPLLASIALHGLETALTGAYPIHKTIDGHRINWKPIVIRYADDFCVFHESEAEIRHIQEQTNEWLKGMGLELKPSKTRITHTLTPCAGHVGFDFLSYHVRQFPVGKTHTGRDAPGRPLGYKTLIQPSKEAMKRHQAAIGAIVREHKTATQAALIAKLNRVICGWVNYHSTRNAKAAFERMAHLTFQKLWSWAKRRHPKKSRHWIARKHWHPERGTWEFTAPDGLRLYRHNRKHIRPHTKVAGRRSIYDGDWAYWATRLGRHPALPVSVAILLKKQQGKCPWFGLYIRTEDVRENDHILPRIADGTDDLSNRQLLHGHCHDEKTRREMRTRRHA
jgi:RNA-directed DNA polymerase